MTFPNYPLILESPAAMRRRFRVTIAQESKGSTNFKVDIGYIAYPAVCDSYTLNIAQHLSYRALFLKASRDFGCRAPSERAADSLTKNSTPELREVLTENLSPKILYGYGDPAVLRVADPEGSNTSVYYLVCTSNDAPDSFPIVRSMDLTTWTPVGFVFPAGTQPDWAETGTSVGDYWAPEMHRHRGGFIVVFTARSKSGHELSIGAATSGYAEGPYRPQTKPLLTGNVIDPHVFVDTEGRRYLYWKKDNNDIWPTLLVDLLYENPKLIDALLSVEADRITASMMVTVWPWARTLQPMQKFQLTQTLIEAVTSQYLEFQRKLVALNSPYAESGVPVLSLLESMRTPFYVQQFAENGTELIGTPVKVLENDQEWEGHLIEGMWVSKINGRYYMFYSGNDFSTDSYGIGAAVADSPFGPFAKQKRPLITTTSKWSGPGHPSLTIAPDGQLRLFMHGYRPGEAAYKAFRALLYVPIEVREDEVFVP